MFAKQVNDRPMKDIAIYGAGGFGREVACLLKRINSVSPQWNLLGFFDDGITAGTTNEYGSVLGGLEVANEWDRPISVVFAIGSPKVVYRLYESITNPNIDFPNLIAPDVLIVDQDNFSMGKGNIISYGCLFSCNTHIGNFNMFNGFITVGHDAVVGDFNAFMPSVRISGGVSVGNRNFFGVNSVVLQYIPIGNDTVIGGSSLIIRKTKDGNTYVGIPAQIVKY